jgi:hypothetical protein
MKNVWQPELYWSPQPKLGGGWIAYKDSPSPPPAPDYAGAARATSAGSVQASIANNLMAHPNIYTPLGSQTWTQTGTSTIPGAEGNAPVDVPTYAQNINMTPEGQDLYSRQLALSKGLMGLGQGSLDQTTASLSKPQDFQSVQDIADQAYKAQTSRLDPQWAHNQEMQDAQLANQGITRGSEAYDNAAREFGQQKNDAYTQARMAAISTMPQTFQLGTAERMQPLTELNAIRSGAQPQMPQFQPTQYSMGAQGANQLGAAQAQTGYNQGLYNSQVGQQNSFMSGLFGLGGAALAAPVGTFSDRRLKRDIVRVADDPRGFGWYLFRYLWSAWPQVGVMADEVPYAATRHPSGFFMVDYGRL